MSGIIYLLTSPSNKCYIGQTTNSFERRLCVHKSAAKVGRETGCVVLNNALRKYGYDKFKKEVLLICNIADLDAYEKKFIELYNTIAPNGYNLMTGGNSNKTYSDVTKEKIRQSALNRDSSVYRTNPLTAGWPKYLGIFAKYPRITKHPKCSCKSFNDKTKTFEENLECAKQYLIELNKEDKKDN